MRQANKAACNAKIPRNSSELRLIIDAIALYEIKRKVGVTSSARYAKKLEMFATVTSLRFSSESSPSWLKLKEK